MESAEIFLRFLRIDVDVTGKRNMSRGGGKKKKVGTPVRKCGTASLLPLQEGQAFYRRGRWALMKATGAPVKEWKRGLQEPGKGMEEEGINSRLGKEGSRFTKKKHCCWHIVKERGGPIAQSHWRNHIHCFRRLMENMKRVGGGVRSWLSRGRRGRKARQGREDGSVR